MNKVIFKINAMLVCFALSGCQQTFNYDYLMQHPEVLQKKYEHCRGQTSVQCDEVVRAAEDFRMLIQQRNEDPESIGLQIMQAQQKADKKTVRVLYAVVRVSQDI